MTIRVRSLVQAPDPDFMVEGVQPRRPDMVRMIDGGPGPPDRRDCCTLIHRYEILPRLAAGGVIPIRESATRRRSGTAGRRDRSSWSNPSRAEVADLVAHDPRVGDPHERSAPRLVDQVGIEFDRGASRSSSERRGSVAAASICSYSGVTPDGLRRGPAISGSGCEAGPQRGVVQQRGGFAAAE